MKRLSLLALPVVACVACPANVPVGPGTPLSDVDDDRCASGAVAVGFPLRPGDYTVGQGNGGAFSHSGINEFGFDFTVDEGTAVVAARSGTVVLVVDGYGPGGPNADLAPEANIVVVDHGGGTFDSYFHLQAGTITVGVGDLVDSGQFLANSGNSGFTSAPHLHFAVVDATMQSLPACFQPGDLVPETDDVVSAVASPLKDPGVFPRSLLAEDTFADDGIALDNDIVAFTIDGTLHVEGRVTDGENRAAVFLTAYGASDVIHSVVVEVDDAGAFVADLDVAGFGGVQSLGLTSVPDDGRYGGATIPVFITE